MNFVEDIKQSLHRSVSECLQSSCDYTGKVVITKRNRDLVRGDFEVRAPKLGNAWPTSTTLLVGKNLMESYSAVSKVHANGDLLLIHLNRTQLYKEVLTRVIHDGEKYGSSDLRQEKCCVYSTLDITEGMSLDNLRSVLLIRHISGLLTANGYEAHTVYRCLPERVSLSSVHETLNGLNLGTVKEDMSNELPDAGDSFTVLSQCQWRHYGKNVNSQDNPEVEGCEGNSKKLTATISLNLRQYKVDTNLVFDKHGYDKNIHIVKLDVEDTRTRQAADIAEISSKLQISRFVHVDGHRKEVHSQQADLLSRILTQDRTEHAHIVHRGVDFLYSKETSDIAAAAYYKRREDEMQRAFSMKYGEAVQGADYQEIIHHVTQAAVTFDLLSTNFSSPVKLDTVSQVDPDDQSYTGGGVFVMYNCARLAMLLSQFHKHVKEGHYSPLPPVGEIDFTTLREQEEWLLLFNYIATYPSVVKETVAALESNVPRPQIYTHKICQFLLDLVRDFSSYYSRTHVLLEAKPHLLPTMFARVTLLTALQYVIHNALKLLNIQPLSHM